MGRICEYCENAFIPRRSDAIYCSHSCKQLAYMARKIKIVLMAPDMKEEKVLLGNDIDCNPCREQFMENYLYENECNETDEIENDENIVDNRKTHSEFYETVKQYNLSEPELLEELKREILLIVIKLQACSFKDPDIQFLYTEFFKVTEMYLSFAITKTVTRKQLKQVRNMLLVVTQSTSFQYLTPEIMSDVFNIADYTYDLLASVEKGQPCQFTIEREKKLLLIAYNYILQMRLSPNELSPWSDSKSG